MANDPYAACLCGSGKKLKFCCQDILADMQRIEQLRDNQPDVAEKHLRALYESHPDKDVLAIELAGLLQEMGQQDDARELCIEFLRRQPDEPRVIVLLADLTMQSEGFNGARRLIHRAIQLAQPAHYQGIAMLLASISDEVFRAGNPASAYAHLRRSIQFAPPELQSSLMMLLSSWTTQITDYFPLLGSLELLEVEVGADHQDTAQRARRLSDLGCWEPSAILYSRLIKEEPDNGPLWYNLGLFYLWDDCLAQAAAALHKAATLLDDFDTAVEAETLAVLLDLEVSDDRICTMECSRPVERPRELSTRLNESDRICLSTPDSQLNSTEMSQDHLRVFADVPRAADGGQEEMGAVIVTANIDGEPTQHVVTVTAEESKLDDVWQVVLEAAGDGIDREQDTTEPMIATSVPTSFADFDWNVHFEPTLPAKKIREAVEGRIAASVDAWLQRPQPHLNDQSPLQASENPDQKVQTAASVIVLYSIAQRLNHEIPLSDLRSRLNVATPGERAIEPDQSIEGVPLLHYAQLSMSGLTDSQLLQMANRVGLIRDVNLLEKVVEELFRRPAALEEYSPRRAHMMRALVARFRNRVDEMAQSFEAARESAVTDADNFQSRLELDLKELTFRLDDPEDPGIPHLLRSMRDQYFQKVPEIAEAVRQELTRSGCEQFLPELDAPLIVTAGQESQPQSTGKLWLPGQD